MSRQITIKIICAVRGAKSTMLKQAVAALAAAAC